jgi:hypothetical protein
MERWFFERDEADIAEALQRKVNAVVTFPHGHELRLTDDVASEGAFSEKGHRKCNGQSIHSQPSSNSNETLDTNESSSSFVLVERDIVAMTCNRC